MGLRGKENELSAVIHCLEGGRLIFKVLLQKKTMFILNNNM